MRTQYFGILLITVLMLTSCGGGKSAPFDRGAFGQIVINTSVIADKKGYDTPLDPQKRIEVMREAFEMSGWSLSATIDKLAKDGVSPFVNNGGNYALATLILDTTKDLSQEEVTAAYSSSEIDGLSDISNMIQKYSN